MTKRLQAFDFSSEINTDSDGHALSQNDDRVLTLVKTDGVLTALSWATDRWRPQAFGPRVSSGFEDVVDQLQEIFADRERRFTVPFTSTELIQKRVDEWEDRTARRADTANGRAIGNRSA